MKRSGHLTGKNSHKIGEAVRGTQVVIPAKNGKEESGIVVYKRKAVYNDDPYEKRIRA